MAKRKLKASSYFSFTFTKLILLSKGNKKNLFLYTGFDPHQTGKTFDLFQSMKIMSDVR